MKTYDVSFRSDLQLGMQEFEADTPEQALELAQRFAEKELDTLEFNFYEVCDRPINEIEVHDDKHNLAAAWYEDDLRLRLAAQDLLDALRFCDIALDDLVASKRNGNLHESRRLARAGITKATGGAQ